MGQVLRDESPLDSDVTLGLLVTYGLQRGMEMVESNLAEEAERLSRRRARMMPVLAMFYLAQQVSYLSRAEGDRLVDHFRIGAWVMLSSVLLAGLVTGGFWLRNPKLRAMLNDEQTQANRARAMQVGFVAAIAMGIVLYVVQGSSPMTVREQEPATVSGRNDTEATALAEFTDEMLVVVPVTTWRSSSSTSLSRLKSIVSATALRG